MPIRLVLADDHVLVRRGLRSLLEEGGFVVVGEAADGREAVRLVRKTTPDVAVLDVAMPNFNGLSAALELGRTAPQVRVLILSEHAEQQYVGEALRCGVRGYVLKSQAAHELVTAIRRICRGEVYLSPGISGAVAAACASPDLVEPELTLRERQVLQLIAEGHSSREIGESLGISVKTAESHRSNPMRKLAIHDTAGLVRYAIRRGLIKI